MTISPTLHPTQWRWLMPSRHMAMTLTALLLCACGGIIEEPLKSPAANASEPTPPAPPATLLAGLYKGKLDSNPSREFLALVLPELGNNVHVYGWYYNANDLHLAHLYEGQLELGIQGNASNVPNSWRVIEGINSYPASANVSGSSLSQLLATLSISRSSVGSYNLTANALPTADYDYTSLPPDVRNTQWDGYWSSGADTATGILQFSANGEPNASGTQWPCLAGKVPLEWKWTAQSTNFYKVELTLGSNTFCSKWENRRLAGVASVSQQNAHRQLDMMLLDGTGAGISYRGTR